MSTVVFIQGASFPLELSAVPVTSGLVAEYAFNEGTGTIVNDHSGNGFNTTSPTSFGSSGAYSWNAQGLYFNGIGGIGLTSSALFGMLTGKTGFTIQVVANITATRPATLLYSDVFAVQMGYSTGDAIQSVLSTSTTANASATDSSTFTANASTGWFVAELVWDGTNLYVYTNNDAGVSKALSGTLLASTVNGFYMGAQGDTGNDGGTIVGTMSYVTVYDRALSAEERQQNRYYFEEVMYSRGVSLMGYQDLYDNTVLKDAPSSYWKLQETSGTSAVDATGNGNTGTYTGGYTLGQTGPMGDEAVYLDGSSGEITTPYTLTFPATPSYSVVGWFNTTTTSGGFISGVATSGGLSDDYNTYMDNTGKINTAIYTAASGQAGGYTVATSTSAYNDGKWHFFAVTFNGSTLTLYMDGVQQPPVSATSASGGVSSVGWVFGYEGVGSYPNMPTSRYFTGYLDKLSLWNSTALTSQQIQELFNVGALYYPLTTYEQVILTDSPTGYWPLQEASGTTATDISGNGNTGTYPASGMVLGQISPPMGGKSVSDNGTTYGINTGFYPSSKATSTIEGWVYVLAAPSSGNAATIAGNFYHTLRISSSMQVDMYLTDNTYNDELTTTATLSLNTWYHIVGTFDNSTGLESIYINGVLSTSATRSILGAVPTTDSYRIGYDENGVNALNGYVAHTAFWDGTALSATQVQNHYNAGNSAPQNISLTGSGTSTTSSSITFNINRQLIGSGTTTTSSSVTLNVNAAPKETLTGSGTSITSSAITFIIRRPLSGSGASTTSSTVTFNINRQLKGSGVSTTSSSVTLQVKSANSISLTGSGTSTTSSSSTLTVHRQLTGLSISSTSSAASLNVHNTLKGTGASTASSTVTFRIQRQLKSTGTSTTSSTATLSSSTNRILKGTGVSVTNSTITFIVHRSLHGSGISTTSGSSQLVTRFRLNSISNASTTSSSTTIQISRKLFSNSKTNTTSSVIVNASRRLLGSGISSTNSHITLQGSFPMVLPPAISTTSSTVVLYVLDWNEAIVLTGSFKQNVNLTGSFNTDVNLTGSF